MNSPSPESPKRPSSESWLILVVLGLVALPPLYILSSGPLAWVADRTGGNWYDTFFAPLIWVYEQYPALQPWLDRYVNWWT